MKRIYHRYEKWEDFHDGMWRSVSKDEERELLEAAINFTGDAELYGSWMMRVVSEWQISCEQNLTNQGMNQLAWVGHAACSMAIKCPEYITRRAWGMLSEEQRIAANEKARFAIETWINQQHDERQISLWHTKTNG